MKLSVKDITIKDLIAGVTVIGGLYLIAKGIDGVVGTAVIMVVAFYFSRFRGQDNNVAK